MNPLINSENCKLYDLDFNFISKIKFSQTAPGSITLIFPKRPDYTLPEQFQLVPDDVSKSVRSFLCSNPSEISEFYVKPTDTLYYLSYVSINGAQNQREDLRVNVSIDVKATFDFSNIPKPITIKNISAGGLMFISRMKYEKDALFSFSFTPIKTQVTASAQIRSIRPTAITDTLAYGCQFVALSKQAESNIRQFIFNYDLQQKKLLEK